MPNWDEIANAVTWLCVGFSGGCTIAHRIHLRRFRKLQTETNARFEKLHQDVQAERDILMARFRASDAPKH